MKNRYFIIIFLILILVSVILIVLPKNFSNDKIVQIIQDKEIIHTINLENVNEPYDITITNENDGYNIVHVSQNSISVTDSNCRDHICIDQGEIGIDSSNHPIVCLPHTMIIKLISKPDNSSQDIDAVSGKQ